MLCANLKPDTAEQLWSPYLQLTETEAALGSELSTRPLFHQLEPRCLPEASGQLAGGSPTPFQMCVL